MNGKSKKNWIVIGLVILVVIGGGIGAYFMLRKNSSSNDNPLPNPSGKLSEQELEKYLLEKRLDLQKYFVFNLQKELKPEKCYSDLFSSGWRIYFSNGKNFVPSLSNHLSKLLGKQKNFICFTKKYTNDIPPEEWKGDKLDQLLNNGEEWYIIFDKSKINDDTCNFINTESVDLKGYHYPTGIALAIESEPEVQVKKNKSEALKLIKTDPALVGKV